MARRLLATAADMGSVILRTARHFVGAKTWQMARYFAGNPPPRGWQMARRLLATAAGHRQRDLANSTPFASDETWQMARYFAGDRHQGADK